MVKEDTQSPKSCRYTNISIRQLRRRAEALDCLLPVLLRKRSYIWHWFNEEKFQAWKKQGDLTCSINDQEECRQEMEVNCRLNFRELPTSRELKFLVESSWWVTTPPRLWRQFLPLSWIKRHIISFAWRVGTFEVNSSRNANNLLFVILLIARQHLLDTLFTRSIPFELYVRY